MTKRLVFGVVGIVALLINFVIATAALADTVIFGPDTYTRTTAEPVTIVKTFSVSNVDAEFTLLIQNGEGKRGKVSSAVVTLNGKKLVSPSELNKQVEVVSKPIELLHDNEIAVEVRSEPGSAIIVSVLGPDAPPSSPISGINVNPDGIFVGEPTSVVIRANIPYDATQGIPVATLIRINELGETISTEGALTDDGNLVNGDEIAGDGVFGSRKVFSFTEEEKIRFQIVFQQGSVSATSDVFFLDAFNHLTDVQLNMVLAIQSLAKQNYDNLVPANGPAGARDMVLADLQQDPNILQAGLSDSSNGIWILYSEGILGGLMLNPEGTLGSLDQLVNQSPDQSLTTSSASIAAAGNSEVGNKKVLLLSPFQSSLAFDVNASLKTLYEGQLCPKFDVKYLTNGAVTVDTFKTLSQYGVINFYGHGDTYYKGILSLWTEQFGWSFIGAQVVILTGQVATAANKKAYEIDLKKGRIAIVSGGGNYYAILPSFVSTYNSSFPNSLVFINACRSTYNSSMANAFINNGSKTYLGYSDYVLATFATTRATDFHNKWVLDPTNLVTTGESFTPGLNDGQATPAHWQMIGANDLELPSGTELQDGGFETGTLGAWKALGDGRVLKQLGQFSPVEGAYMGIISTGLGFTTSSGSIEQKVCLPSTAKTLDFSWNFNSEEFVEWCGSSFQDTFHVDVITDTGTQNLLSLKVDDLCSSVTPSNLKFDQSSGACTPTPGVGSGTGGNDCTVWTTGWQSQSSDISGIATSNQGKPVTINFSTGDVGDSIFDTGVLVDNIRITNP